VDHYFSATTDQLYQAIQEIKQKVDRDDQIVVYTFGHGGAGSIPCLQDSCNYDWFVPELNSMVYGSRAIVLTGCYSGDAKNDFLNQSATLFASTGCPGEITYGSLYHDYFWTEMKNLYHNNPFYQPAFLTRCFYAQSQFRSMVNTWEYASVPICEVSADYFLVMERAAEAEMRRLESNPYARGLIQKIKPR